MTRIEATDNGQSMVVKMSDGNPGVMQALMLLLSKGCEEIDQDNMLKPFGPLLSLDTLGIYGTGIYILWNDKCKRDIRRLIMLLRATQLRLLPSTKVQEMANDQMRQINLSADEWAELDSAVVDRLPGFMSAESWTAKQELIAKELADQAE